jgi:hypothetical protein
MADTHTKLQFDMIRQLIGDHELSSNGKVVGVLIVDRLHRKDDAVAGIKAGHTRIGHSSIERITGIPERSVKRAIAELRERGHLAVDGAPWKGEGPGRGRVNVYQPIFKDEPQGDLFAHLDAEDAAQKRSKWNREKGSPVAPFSSMPPRKKRGQIVQEKGSPVARRTSASVCKKDGSKQEREKSSALALEDGAAPLGRAVTKAEEAIPPRPTETMVAYAVEKGWSEIKAWNQYDLFVAWHAAKGKIPANLEAAWQIWVLRGIEHDHRDQRNGMPSYAVALLDLAKEKRGE